MFWVQWIISLVLYELEIVFKIEVGGIEEGYLGLIFDSHMYMSVWIYINICNCINMEYIYIKLKNKKLS